VKSVAGNDLVRFIRYGIVGLLTNGAVYVAFLLMVEAGLNPVASSAVCYCLALALSYPLNRTWTFKSNARHRRDVPRFLLAYVAGFVFSVACVAVCLIWFPPAIAQLMTIGLTAIVIYSMLRIVRFGQEKFT
jgi:putative flippase GtrA